MQKQQIRIHMRARRRQHAQSNKAEAAIQLHRQVIQLPSWRHAKHIAIYYPKPEELDTRMIIDAAWASKKSVYLPVTRRAQKDMHFYQYKQNSHLIVGHFGISQPEILGPPADAKLDCMILPAIALDESGFRLGYGFGYYDRFLACQQKQITTIGVAYACNRIKKLPHDEHDKPCDISIWV